MSNPFTAPGGRSQQSAPSASQIPPEPNNKESVPTEITHSFFDPGPDPLDIANRLIGNNVIGNKQ
jgi:hypothetical protein